MRLTVLGKSPAYQDVGGACSGYLIEDGESRILLECGSGVFANLRSYVDYFDVDAIVISHFHADHCLDLIPYAYAILYTSRKTEGPLADTTRVDKHRRGPRLFAPPGAKAIFNQITSAWQGDGLIADAFDLVEYEIGTAFSVGTFTVNTLAMPHYIPSNAVDVRSSKSGRRLTFSADLGPTPELDQFAKETDLLLIEAGIPYPETGDLRGHLTPVEAGKQGSQANASRVVVTHFSDELESEWILDQARRAFGNGRLELASHNAVFEI